MKRMALLVAVLCCTLGADAWHVSGYPAVRSQPVTFHNGTTTLHGVLYYPAGAQHVPAIVALHSAGVSQAGAPLFEHLRTGLPQIGMAVLLYTRRSNPDRVGYETLAGDAIAGARAIGKLPQIDAARIGYWGLSQGGWLALLAAKQDAHAAFAVAVSAPLVTPEEQMSFADATHLRILGYSDADVHALLAARKAWTSYLRGTGSRSSAIAALRAIDSKPWFSLMYMPSSAQLAGRSASTWRKKMDDDLLASVRDIHVPLLFVFGGADPWIPVATTVARLKRLQADDPNIDFAVIAGAAHEMLFRRHETMTITPQSLWNDAPVAPAYLMLLSSWLTKHALK